MDKKVILSLVAIALLVFGVFYSQGNFKTQEAVFYEVCEEVLKARLAAPSSYLQTKEPFVFIVEEDGQNVAKALMGYDASNALGVMLGGTALCTLELGSKSELPTSEAAYFKVRVDGTTEIEWHVMQAQQSLDALR